MKFFQTTLFVIFLFIMKISAQQAVPEFLNNKQKVEQYFKALLPVADDSLYLNGKSNERMISAALFLLGTPYVAQTLEVNDDEDLVINLYALDCTTFVENCLALSRAAQYPHTDYDSFVRQLKYIRYRNGIIQGYTSRLHYMTDWITDNASKGTIEDITKVLGGKQFCPQVRFMSSHPDLYPKLMENPNDIKIMDSIEKTINHRTTYYYIPKNEIREKQSLIKNGDIICFTTGLSGLDISHTGIAYRDNDKLTFIHASGKYKKVIVNPESLVDYCNEIKNNTGIMVLRPVFKIL